MSKNLEDHETPEVDIDKLMDEIRKGMAQRRDKTDELRLWKKPEIKTIFPRKPLMMDVSEIRSLIMSAETQADIGAQVTPMTNFRGLTRKIALLVGKLIIYLTSFMTVKQRIFNEVNLRVLTEIANNLETLGQQNAFLINTLKRLRTEQIEIKNSIKNIKTKQEEIKELEKNHRLSHD